MSNEPSASINPDSHALLVTLLLSNSITEIVEPVLRLIHSIISLNRAIFGVRRHPLIRFITSTRPAIEVIVRTYA